MAALRKLLIRGIAGWSILATGAMAQVRVLQGPDQNAAEPKDATEGVFVPESSLALERLALAEKMERLKEWNKSADLYQEVLTDPKYAGKVVAAESNDDHRLFRSVEDLVMQKLSKWPPEGLEVYRGRYEAQAQAMLDKAGPNDVHTLHQVFSRYFVTQAGKNAGIRLMDLDLEQGEFRAVVSVGERLLNSHPGLGDDRAGVLFRGAIALHLSHEDAAAKARLADLQREFPQAHGTVRGKDVLLVDALTEELKVPVSAIASASGSDSYTTFGGDPTRNHVAPATGTPGAHLYSIQLSRPTFVAGPQGQQQQATYKEAVKNGGTLCVTPVVDRDEMFFQDGQRIYGVNLESGVPLAGWAKTNGVDHFGSFKFNGVAEAVRLRQLTLTLTDHAVLGIMGRVDPVMMRMATMSVASGTLVCVDRQTGKLNWQTSAQQLQAEALRGLQFGGSPLVVGDNVLIGATASKQAGFEDCYVLCFKLSDGTLRWSTNVASSMTTSMNPLAFNNGFGGIYVPNDSHLAYANGLAYIQSNRGVVAAVDVYSGAIAWLSTYRRGDQATNVAFNPMLMQGGVQQSAGKPWTGNPVMISQGLVFTLPTEGKHLLILDAISGQTIKRIDLDDLAQHIRNDDSQQISLDTLIGISGDMLVIGGGKSIVAVNWRKYNDDHYDDNTMLYWEEAYPGEIRGRPFLTRDMLYLALDERMYMINVHDGMAVKDYPSYPRTWSDDEGAGNLVVTGDHAIVAGAEHVDVYTDLSAAKHKLDAEVAAYPDAPDPRLRYAEVTYAAGDYPTALTKLDEAIARAGGTNIPHGEIRDRIFNDALNFAQRLRTDQTPDGRQRVISLFDRAQSAASSPEQQVQYRLSRAAFDQIRVDLPSAVQRYQEVLSDPQWRAVMLPEEASRTPVSADRVARLAIAKLMKIDPSVYQPFESKAAEALEKARQTSDPQQLLEVAQAYPNSSVAGAAMLAGADAFEQAGQPQLARHVLLDMYFDRDSRSADRALVAEALARTDAHSAARLLAAASLEQNDAKLKKPIKMFDGTEISAGTSFSEAAKTAAKARAQAKSPELPTFGLPMPPKADRDGNYPKPFAKDGPVLSNVASLPTPVAGFSRNDRVVVWTTEPKLSVYGQTLGEPLGFNKEIVEEPQHTAWLGDDLIVWGAKQIALVREDGRTVAWKLDLGSLPSIEALTPGETADIPPQMQPQIIGGPMILPGIRGRRGMMPMPIIPIGPGPQQPVTVQGPQPERIERILPVGKLLLIATSNGRVACVDLKDHQLRWQARLMDRPVTRLLATEDFTIIVAENESSVTLEAVDTFSGHVRGTTPFVRATNAYPQNLALADDGTLVYTLPDRICFKDLFKPWTARDVEQRLPQGTATYLGMTGADQLLVAGDRVVALADSGGVNGPGEKFVHVYALNSGAAVTVPVAEKQQVELALTAGTKQARTHLAVLGSRLFTISPDACNSYDLDRLDQHEALFGRETPLAPVWQTFLGSDFLIMVGEDADPNDAHPIPPGNGPLNPNDNHKVLLSAFGRYQTQHGEGTRLDYQFHLAESSGIAPHQLQPVNGGLVYRSNDHKVHLLVGAGKH